MPNQSQPAGAGEGRDVQDRPATSRSSTERLNRGFGFGSAISLAFADVSPIVALYSVFAICIFAVGPQFFWLFLVVLVGQLLVAGVFGELASRWPYAGSVYQWARHVHPRRAAAWSWAAAWAYVWGFTIALAVVVYAASSYLLEVFEVKDPGRWTVTAVALVLVVVGTATNMLSRRALKVVVVVCIVCEVVASLVLGLVLLVFYRVNPVSTLFDGLPDAAGIEWSAVFVVLAYVCFALVGFESAGSIAEEVREPERYVPRAIIGSLAGVGAIVLFASAALILAIPDLDGVLAEQAGDPVSATLFHHMGSGLAKPLLVMFVIGFCSSFLAVQAAVSRCIWGLARDGGIPASGFFNKLGGPERLPVNAIGLTALIVAGLLLLAGSNVYDMLVTSSAIGMYIAFGIPVIGAALNRSAGRWTPGVFSLGRWGALVTYSATAWVVVAIVNMVWPRSSPGQAWYDTWAMLILTTVLGVLGAALYAKWGTQMDKPVGERLFGDEAGLK